MSLKKTLIKNKFTYKIYLYYNLFIRHKGFIKRKQYSQWGEDVYINEYFKKLEKGIYLDIGCFHPFMYSNTCLLFNKGWTGINVDINQTSIDLFNIVRPNDTNICTTISEEEKTLPPPQILIMSSGEITPFSLMFNYEGDFNEEPVYFALQNKETPPLSLTGPLDSPE